MEYVLNEDEDNIVAEPLPDDAIVNTPDAPDVPIHAVLDSLVDDPAPAENTIVLRPATTALPVPPPASPPAPPSVIPPTPPTAPPNPPSPKPPIANVPPALPHQAPDGFPIASCTL